MGKYSKLDKQAILHCYETKTIAFVDLTDVLSKFSELFSVIPFDPASKEPFELDPNDAIVPPPIFPQKRGDGGNSFMKSKIVISKSPFSSSTLIDDPATRGWYYIDEADITQGPFTSLEMDNWFDQGFLFNELLVRFDKEEENGEFSSLIDLFGKVEYPQFPITRKIERRVSMKENDELPSLGFSRFNSQNERNPIQRHRFSYNPECSDSLQRNIWQDFLEKRPEDNLISQVSDKTVENKPSEGITRAKPQEVIEPKAQQQQPHTEQASVQKEEKEATNKKSLKTQDDNHKIADKKIEHPKQDSNNSKTEQVAARKESHELKTKKEETHNVESHVHEEKKGSNKNKKNHKSPKNQTNEQNADHYHGHTRDKRFRKGSYVVFEPKVEQPELKDKGQENYSKHDNSKYSTGVNKSGGNHSKNSQFFE